MKTQIILLTLSLIGMTQTFKVPLKFSPVQQSPVEGILSPPLLIPKDYSKCFQYLEGDIEDVAAIAADIIAQRWVGMVEKIIALAKDLYETVECFKNNSFKHWEKIIEILMTVVNMEGDQRECILEKLKDAMGLVKKALRDALSGNTDALGDDFQKIMDDLEYALNDC